MLTSGPLALDVMRPAAHVGLLTTLFWYRDAYAALYNDASQLPSATFDFVIVGGMSLFQEVVLVVLMIVIRRYCRECYG